MNKTKDRQCIGVVFFGTALSSIEHVSYRRQKRTESDSARSVLFSCQSQPLGNENYFRTIYLLTQMRYIFANAQMRYNLPYGRLRYDINPSREARSRPKGISHRRYIARVSVYRKSRKGFISPHSVPRDTAPRSGLFCAYLPLFALRIF